MLTCSSWAYGAADGQFYRGCGEAEPVLLCVVRVFGAGSKLVALRQSQAGVEGEAQVLALFRRAAQCPVEFLHLLGGNRSQMPKAAMIL